MNKLIALLLMLAAPCPLQAQAGAGRESGGSVQHFVQNFLEWYVPIALRGNDGPAWDLALKTKPEAFGAALLRALQEDSRAQARVHGEIVGLDGDPFLNTQDPCDGYEARRVSRHGRRYRVEIYAVCDGQTGGRPAVLAELVRKQRSWAFVNFHYPDERTDLLAVLRALRAERREGRAARPSASVVPSSGSSGA